MREAFEREQTVERAARLSVAELKAKYGDWTKDFGGKVEPAPAEPHCIEASEITISPYLQAALKRKKDERP